jgi:hypothetical protein
MNELQINNLDYVNSELIRIETLLINEDNNTARMTSEGLSKYCTNLDIMENQLLHLYILERLVGVFTDIGGDKMNLELLKKAEKFAKNFYDEFESYNKTLDPSSSVENPFLKFRTQVEYNLANTYQNMVRIDMSNINGTKADFIQNENVFKVRNSYEKLITYKYFADEDMFCRSRVNYAKFLSDLGRNIEGLDILNLLLSKYNFASARWAKCSILSRIINSNINIKIGTVQATHKKIYQELIQIVKSEKDKNHIMKQGGEPMIKSINKLINDLKLGYSDPEGLFLSEPVEIFNHQWNYHFTQEFINESSSQPSSAIKKCLISLLIVSCVRLVSVYFILSGKLR